MDIYCRAVAACVHVKRINVAQQGSNWEELESPSPLKEMFGATVSISEENPPRQEKKKKSNKTSC